MLNLIKSIIRIIKTVLASVVLVVLVIFMVNNREIITIHLSPLSYNIETRIFLVMIFFFLFGMLFGFLAFSEKMINKSINNFQDLRKLKKLEKKVSK